MRNEDGGGREKGGFQRKERRSPPPLSRSLVEMFMTILRNCLESIAIQERI